MIKIQLFINTKINFILLLEENKLNVNIKMNKYNFLKN